MSDKVDNNLIRLSGEVDVDMYNHFYDSLSRADSDRPLTIALNTEGGHFYHGLAIYDLIRAVKQEVTVIGEGHVMSTGIILLQAADHRLIRPHCKLMVHYGEDSQETLSDAKHNSELAEDYVNIMANNVNVSKRTVKGWLNTNTYFNAEKALKVGLVDEVLYV